MKSATGEISSFLGQIAVELKLGKTLIKHKVLIANIPIEGILGSLTIIFMFKTRYLITSVPNTAFANRTSQLVI
jgi:hypothetical protein